MIDLSLYLVTDRRLIEEAGHTLTSLVLAATSAGVTTVQIREKEASAREFHETVREIASVIPAHVALIINDRVDVFLAARAAGAQVAGVHIGQGDLPAELVRELIGPDAILGVSASTDAELAAASASPARIDYIGIGALHATTTKTDAPPPLGLPEFARLVASTPLPAVAIGGVSASDLPAIRAAGGAGAAVVSAICSAPGPAAATSELRTAWEGTP